jgi:preprotein translocase subunit SecF
MNVWSKLYRGETEFDFVRHRRRTFIISAVLITVSLLSLVFRGLHGSVDFTGGTIVEAPNQSGVSVADYRDALGAIGQEGARVQIRTESDGTQTAIVHTEALAVSQRDALVDTVADVAGVDPNDTTVNAVGPTFGSEITRRAIEALIIFLLVVAAFISWRFEWKMAAAALAALFHDLIVTAGVYSIVGFEVTPATVIAVLTILGYSLYDTVVVFDKITENVHEIASRATFTEIANLSMNQVLMRSINTSATSLLPIGSLLVLGSYLLGAATLREFALALFIGIAAGTYSSIFIATPLLTGWKEREADWQRIARRVARRSEQTVVAKPKAVEEPAPAAASAGGGTRKSNASGSSKGSSGATPRAPKRRRKRR